MSNPDNVQGYKVYCAEDSSMDNIIWQSDNSNVIENSGNTFTMICNDVNLNDNQIYYITVAALMTDGSELISNPEDATFINDPQTGKPLPVKNFKIVVPGENIPPTAVISTDKTSGTTPLIVNFDGSASSDVDGNVLSYAWNFGDGSALESSVNPSHTFSNTGAFEVSLIVTDNEGQASDAALLNVVTTDSPSGSDYAINFQPSSADIPNGFLVDSGRAFDAGKGYGWINGPFSMGTRDRDESKSPDQAYDTMIHVDQRSVWEMALSNGKYSVTICNGDPSFPQGTQSVQAEGTTVIDNASISKSSPWVEKSTTITVADGRLSITFTGSANPARLCWLKITAIK
jgi:PKD repeat protein